jgi:hypothetical protein
MARKPWYLPSSKNYNYILERAKEGPAIPEPAIVSEEARIRLPVRWWDAVRGDMHAVPRNGSLDEKEGQEQSTTWKDSDPSFLF